MSEKLECKRCDRLFTSEEAPIGKCPVCNGTLNYQTKSRPNARSTVTATPKWSSTAESKQKMNEANLEVLVAAQNRTTYAVRSIALYLFISITSSSLGVALIYLLPSAAVLGALIVLIGFVTSIAVGTSELTKSKP